MIKPRYASTPPQPTHYWPFVTSRNYTITRLLETHAHADHLTAAYYIQQKLNVENQANVLICTRHRIRQVQDTFARRYGVPGYELDNAFDHLFQDDETFQMDISQHKSFIYPIIPLTIAGT